MSRQDKGLEDEVRLIEGGLAADDRGIVSFVNDFDFQGVKRFYTVTNHRAGFVRAWHAHRREGKYITVVQGAAIVGAVPLTIGNSPPRILKFTATCSRRRSQRCYTSRRDMLTASCH